MGEQIRAEDWLPEGWKVEIRVRRNGRRDRYYTDPTNGYIFRSLKDVDRYLITGKLGRHVTKTKLKDLGTTDDKLDVDTLPDVSKEKKLLKSNGLKKTCLVAGGEKLVENVPKRAHTRTQKSKEMAKKIGRFSKERTSNSSRKRESTPFFILDSDQCDEGRAMSIPNLSEIIDSIQRKQDGHNNVYVSAPAIGALLGGQQQEPNGPLLGLNICENNIKPTFPCTAPEFHLDSSLENSSRLINTEGKAKEMRSLPFGDLLIDPCIDFAIKTLIGSTM